MSTENEKTDTFAQAFALGFMVSREGFNGDCTFDHCGPMAVEAYCKTIEEYMVSIEESERFRELRDAAKSKHSLE
tara:strand:+ start:529 stop:753 length:225 start_codon:yes stop_codon:yes gene_type:complete